MQLQIKYQRDRQGTRQQQQSKELFENAAQRPIHRLRKIHKTTVEVTQASLVCIPLTVKEKKIVVTVKKKKIAVTVKEKKIVVTKHEKN